MSGRSHRFLCITSTFWEVNVSCSRIQHGDPSEDPGRKPVVSNIACDWTNGQRSGFTLKTKQTFDAIYYGFRRVKVNKYIRMWITIFKLSFGEVYHRIYDRKSCFTAMLPQMKILNTVIP